MMSGSGKKDRLAQEGISTVRKTAKDDTPDRMLSFHKLARKSLLEMWTVQLFSAAVLFGLTTGIRWMISTVADTTGHAISTGNIKELFVSWRMPVLLILGIILVSCYIVLEIFMQIYVCDEILNGRPIRLFQELKKSFLALKRFLTPEGIGLLIFVFIAVPLCGIGFSISISSAFYIPNFIFEVIGKKPVLFALYIVGMIVLAIVAYLTVFSFHGILIGGMMPKEAMKNSLRLLKGHHRRFILGIGLTFLVISLIQTALSLLTGEMPVMLIERAFSDIPPGYPLEVTSILDFFQMTQMEMRVAMYRQISCAVLVTNAYVALMATLLCNAYFQLRLARYYFEFSGHDRSNWPARPVTIRVGWRLALIIGIYLFLLLFMMICAMDFSRYFKQIEPVKVIAHRAGGDLASENSLDGIYAAIDHQCYGSEIDIQRTKDGYYVVNHDDTFKRLAGVDLPSYELTLEEIKGLRIDDTSGSGKQVEVATLEEMLDAIRGKIRLFIELKGATADEQMVDDVVAMVREKDMVGDVVLISLKYDVIDYAETKYPEFDTGTLIFVSLGSIGKMNCDYLIMEEEMATPALVGRILDYGKSSIVWTVNLQHNMTEFLNSNVSAVITDSIIMAEEVQEKLDARTDLEVIRDAISDVFS